VRERVSASKQLGEADARRLIESAKTVYVAKGAKLDRFSGGKPEAEHVQLLLGATGNLRAPTIQVGKTLLVGFNEEQYEKVFG
jgi:arsenate reductase-like glutaredoxin family protein